MHAYIYRTREKHPGRVAQGHKKRKEEILRNKEQSKELQNSPSVQSKEQLQNSLSVQDKEQPSVQSTVQITVQSNNIYVYGVGIIAVLAISVCVFFTYNASQSKNKKTVHGEKQGQPPKRRHML